jgi:hypothetical protein
MADLVYTILSAFPQTLLAARVVCEVCFIIIEYVFGRYSCGSGLQKFNKLKSPPPLTWRPFFLTEISSSEPQVLELLYQRVNISCSGQVVSELAGNATLCQVALHKDSCIQLCHREAPPPPPQSTSSLMWSTSMHSSSG